jgi:riboflavin kinase / FMN adenylyltransferase
MEVHYGYEGLTLNKPVITMGVFDGVHRGHRMLICKVVNEARRRGSDAVVVTFDPHPRIVLDRNTENLSFLTDIDERILLLKETGIDHLVIIPFTKELSNLTACEFIESILCGKLGVNHLVAGFNHHFGKKHEGTGETIIECSGRMGFSVSREEALTSGNIVVSSSEIRNLLQDGNVEKAAELLGYPYFITGRVVSGDKIGRGIGFPTANIEPLFKHKLIPGNGVYAVNIEFDNNGESLIAMLNIGTRPTINNDNKLRTIEAYVINFSGDLYDKNARVRFRFRLRDELKFDSLEDLAEQMKADMERTKSLLG